MPTRQPEKPALPPGLDQQLRQAIAARLDAGESLNALAHAASVSQPTLQRYVAGTRDLHWQSVVKLAGELGLEWKKTKK